jgi:cellulose synthase/poly-beta-1,6-N-acetylglucosamine synthase-like glycosyltransferase
LEVVASQLLLALAGLLAIPVNVFLIEIVAALALHRRSEQQYAPLLRRRVAVLVPAHNESIGLLPTLADVKKQLVSDDRLLVVADNCTDDTAAVAKAEGAEVVERYDSERRGKGYALDFGLAYLAKDPAEIVIIIDADCRLTDGTIYELASTCAATHRPVQALYLMRAPAQSRINHYVAEFAWRIKNCIRPLGLRRLGLPCQLLGTGMAFPWDVIRKADLASGAIVEDLELGLELARAGSPPLFCPTATVTSEFSSSSEGAKTQRLRWEQGHLAMILAVPSLIYHALARENYALLALALDVAVPPLALLALLTVAVTAVAGFATAFGCGSAALTIGAANVSMLGSAVFLAWLRCGRDVLPLRSVFSLLSYVAGKLPLYIQILFRPQKAWIRTDRGHSKEVATTAKAPAAVDENGSKR